MEDCIFCKIASGRIPTEKVYEDDRAVAFRDINPSAPQHVLIVPREHIVSVNEVSAANEGLIGHLFSAAAKVAKKLGVDETGYRCVISTGPDAGQLVMHLHIHLLGGRKLDWPPG